MHPGARVAVRVEADPERRADGSPHVLGERHLGTLGEMVGEHAERLIRVDAAVARAGDRRLALERKSGCVREQVAHGRAGRTGGLVEVDHPLLRGDEHRERGDGLGHRGKSNGECGIAVRRGASVLIDDTRCREVDRPAVDLAKCLHARRY